jgi:hypothetical protein
MTWLLLNDGNNTMAQKVEEEGGRKRRTVKASVSLLLRYDI